MSNPNRGAPPYVRNIKSPGLEFGASSQFRSPVPQNLNVSTVGAVELGVGDLNVSGTFTFTNVDASLITQTSFLEEFTSGQGIQLVNNLRINNNATFFQIPVWDTSGVALGGTVNIGGYDTSVNNTMPMTNTSSGGISFYNSNGVMAYITKNGADIGTIALDRITSITPSLGVEAINLVIGTNSGFRPGSIRFNSNVLQYCDNFGTYITLAASGGSSLIAGNGISIVGNTVSLQPTIANLTSVSSTDLVAGSVISYSGVTGFLKFPSGSSLQLQTSTSINGPTMAIDGAGKLTISPATSVAIGPADITSTVANISTLVLGNAGATANPGGVRYFGDRIQYCNASAVWSNIAPDLTSGTNINIVTDGSGNKTINTTNIVTLSANTTSHLLTLTNTNNLDSQIFAKLTNSGTSDPSFELVAARGAVTNAQDSIVAQLAMRYSSGVFNSAVRFHRGAGATDGYMSFSTNNTERMRINGSGVVSTVGNMTVGGTLGVTGAATFSSILGSTTAATFINATNLNGGTNVALAYYSGFSAADTTKIQIGRSEDPGGVAVIKHNYVSGLDPNNSAVFGIYGNENLIRAYLGGWVRIQNIVAQGSGQAESGGIRMSGTAFQYYNTAWNSVCPLTSDGGISLAKGTSGTFNAITAQGALSTGQSTRIVFGKDNANYGSGVIAYLNGPSTSTRIVTIGLLGDENMLQILRSGILLSSPVISAAPNEALNIGLVTTSQFNANDLAVGQLNYNSTTTVLNTLATVCRMRVQVQYQTGPGVFVTQIINDGFDNVTTDGQSVTFTLTKKNFNTSVISLNVSYASSTQSFINPRQTMIGVILSDTTYQVLPYVGVGASLTDMLDDTSPNAGFYFDLMVF